jgi:D-methionine transport system ATP-binding protein
VFIPVTPAPCIAIETVSKAFGANPALRAVSLEVRQREIFGLIGASGAGKSTLLRLINGLERADSGAIRVEGQSVAGLDGAGLRALRRRIGMIFQHFNLLTAKTAAQNVALPMELEGTRSRAEIAARTAALLERVGLADHAAKYPAQLSGGQKQRVGVARALACAPSILLCDEATSALDPETTAQVLDLLASLNQELGLTIVLITHEMEVVRRICDRVGVLERGALVEQGDVIEVFLDPRDGATRRMLHEDSEPLPPPAPGERRVRLIARGAVVEQKWLSRIMREASVELALHEGRIARIKGEAYGRLTATLSGGDIDKAIALLRAEGLRVLESAA